MLLNEYERVKGLCSEKFETFEIWAMFTLEGPNIVMSRTDAQNGLDFRVCFFLNEGVVVR
jgi:hypothetical protein